MAGEWKNEISLRACPRIFYGSVNSILSFSKEPRYNIAIESARASKFIHEEALAWYVLDCEMQLDYSTWNVSFWFAVTLIFLLSYQSELAAKHYERNCDPDMAISLYRQAKECYREWGSMKKVQHVAEAIERITQGKHPGWGIKPKQSMPPLYKCTFGSGLQLCTRWKSDVASLRSCQIRGGVARMNFDIYCKQISLMNSYSVRFIYYLTG